MTYPRNLILFHAGEMTQRGELSQRSAASLKTLAKIVYECIVLDKTCIISGSDTVGVASALVVRDEIARLDSLGAKPDPDLVITQLVQGRLLGKEYDVRGDDDESEDQHSRFVLSKQIVDLVEKECTEQNLNTVILITHDFQSLIVQQRYAFVALDDREQCSYGQVCFGEGIWMHKDIGTVMAVHLHDKLPKRV